MVRRVRSIVYGIVCCVIRSATSADPVRLFTTQAMINVDGFHFFVFAGCKLLNSPQLQ